MAKPCLLLHRPNVSVMLALFGWRVLYLMTMSFEDAVVHAFHRVFLTENKHALLPDMLLLMLPVDIQVSCKSMMMMFFV